MIYVGLNAVKCSISCLIDNDLNGHNLCNPLLNMRINDKIFGNQTDNNISILTS